MREKYEVRSTRYEVGKGKGKRGGGIRRIGVGGRGLRSQRRGVANDERRRRKGRNRDADNAVSSVKLPVARLAVLTRVEQEVLTSN